MNKTSTELKRKETCESRENTCTVHNTYFMRDEWLNGRKDGCKNGRMVNCLSKTKTRSEVLHSYSLVSRQPMDLSYITIDYRTIASRPVELQANNGDL